MEKATKAIKRGSIRLKSYSEINLILSDLNDMRTSGKTHIKAQQTFMEDLLKWAHHEANDRIQNSFSLLLELNHLWTEIHNELLENLKKFRQMFELILEGEHTIEKARNKVADCEQIESKLSKERTKALERWNSREDPQNLTEKLRDAERATEIARIEVAQKDKENKAIKLIRIKDGLKKLTDSYLKLSQKNGVIMKAQKIVVNELPDEVEVDREVQFSSECKMKSAVSRAKTTIQAMHCSSDSGDGLNPVEYDAPPPYSPYYGASTSNSLRSNLPSTSSPPNRPDMNVNLNTWWQQINPGRRLIDHSGCSEQPTLYVCGKCSAQMISDHKYFSANATEADPEVASTFRNTRIS